MNDIDILKDSNGQINSENIKKIIPYGHPFLFVDKVLSLEKNKIIAIKDVNLDEEFFKGHFVDFPIMPGALIIEGLGQTGTLLVRYNIQNHEEKDILAYKIKEVSFKQPTFPGMQIRYEVESLFQDERGAILKGRVYRNDDNSFTAEAIFVLAVVGKKEFRSKLQGI